MIGKTPTDQKQDPRLEKIYSLLIKYTLSDFSERGVPSDKGDEFDAILVGLNTLGEELQSRGKTIDRFQDRIDRIMQALLRYTLMEFDERLEVSDHGDELDAISVGLNTLVEELIAANEQKHAQIRLLENQKREIEQLISSLKNNNNQLELSNNELDAFTYSVSHDLRAPLRAIHGYTNIILAEYADKIDDEGKEMMLSVSKNAKKMGQLIDDLLSFSKTGKRELHLANTDIKTLAEECIAEMNRLFSFDNVEISVSPMPPVFADISMMRQVYLNLISNALKYSAKKEKIKIEIGAKQEKGKTVYYVKDNGVGFDMKYYDKLFGVFSRLHSAEEFEGTGVGLALVRRIITKHGGAVWAEGKPDEGATFYFTLKV